jgi:hypothetical protein
VTPVNVETYRTVAGATEVKVAVKGVGGTARVIRYNDGGQDGKRPREHRIGAALRQIEKEVEPHRRGSGAG